MDSIKTNVDRGKTLSLYNFYFRCRRGKTAGDTKVQNGQNTSGYLNNAFTNDYANIGNIFPDYIA